MPKIIENVRERLLDEVRKQVDENGYESVTIRSIARECQIGLGTFYNYFKSKDVLIATYLLEDWESRLLKINELAEKENEPMELIKAMNYELDHFMQKHSNVFTSEAAIKTFRMTEGVYHKLLTQQLSEPIHKLCARNGYENAEFLSQFVAEATLTWTVEKKTFEELSPLMCKLFIK